MEWILGAGSLAGLLGVVGLAFYTVRMTRGFVAYNRELAGKLLEHFEANLQLSKESYELHNRIKDLDDALFTRTKERDRERAARVSVQQLLDHAIEELARRADAAGAVATIRRDLRRLSEVVSGTIDTAASPDRHVPGTSVPGVDTDDRQDRDP